MKTILKALAWFAVFMAITLAILYGFWLILIFWLFSYWQVWLVIVAELGLFALYFKLIRMID